MEFLSPHVAMIPSRQSPVSKVSFRQGRFSSRCISSVLPVILPELAAGAMIAYYKPNLPGPSRYCGTVWAEHRMNKR